MGKIVTKRLLILMATWVLASNSQAQNLWGAEALVGQAEGQFDGDFVQTGDVNSLATDSWTALSVFDTGGDRTPGEAYWTRNLQGYSQGAYWGGTTPINSPSQANGVALFDSDFLDNNGVQNAFGTGSSPSGHKGELISPRIDLTGNTDARIGVKFYAYYRDFLIPELSFSVSTDDGTTWTTVVDLLAELPAMTEDFILQDLPTDTLAGISNLTAVRIKFTFDGDYYFAIVDDVTIYISDLIYTNGFETIN